MKSSGCASRRLNSSAGRLDEFCVRLRLTSLLLSFWRGVQEREHVFDHLPQAAVEREVVVHQVDEEVVVVDVLNDHA